MTSAPDETTTTAKCALCKADLKVPTRIYRPYRTYFCESCHSAVLRRATA